jgi:hypothetical protein
MTTIPESPVTIGSSGLVQFLHRFHPAQLIKWTVYTLLLLNWVYYGWDEWEMAQYTLRHGGSLLDWSTAFSTTIDEGAWFGLLFLWELETYWLPYDWNRPWMNRGMMLLRLVCYVFLSHTVIARAIDFHNISTLEPMANINSACDLAGQEISYTHNLEYILIDKQNCAGISQDSEFFAVEKSSVTDRQNFRQEEFRVWIDLQDAITWLLVMFSIEIAIWLQERNITGGPLMLVSYAAKAFYGVLFFHAAYWVWNGHWIYGWDQVLWILGFFAIEMNVKDWREELQEEDAEEALLAAHGTTENT